MILRLLVTFGFLALIIYLANYHSIAVAVFAGLGLIGLRAIYLISTKKGRNQLFGVFFWRRLYKKYRNTDPAEGASLKGSGQIGPFSYWLKVTTNEKGIVLKNLSSSLKRDIYIPWEKISTIDVWKNKNDSSIYAKATFSNEPLCEHLYVPWSTKNNSLVPHSVGMSGLQ